MTRPVNTEKAERELALTTSDRNDRLRLGNCLPIAITRLHPSRPGVLQLALSGGERFALIDEEDLPLVEKYYWCLLEPQAGYPYACARTTYKGKKVATLIHRLIMMVGPSKVVDHINGDGLDNTKANLRVCSHQENLWNAKLSVSNRSGIKGVSQLPKGRFRATLKRNGKATQKTFDTALEATAWVQALRDKTHGEFARHA